jgi:hypothetical protein
MDAIHDSCLKLCDVLLKSYNSRGFCNNYTSWSVEVLRKYYKIIHNSEHQRCVHAFVDKKTGDIYKPAGWRGPAKIARFNILTEWNILESNADWAGSYLYLK